MKYFIFLTLLSIFLNSTIPEVKLNQKTYFNNTYHTFSVNYTKKTDKSFDLLLFYEITTNVEFIFTCHSKDSAESSTIENKNGYIRLNYKDIFEILFSPANEGDILEGNFKLISTELPFTLDINENISLTNLLNLEEPCPLIFTFENFTNEIYIKEIDVLDDNPLLISENGSEYREVKNKFLYLQKNTNYTFKLEFIKIISDIEYYSTSLLITDFDPNLIKIEDLSFGVKFFNNKEKYFIKINFNENNNLYIKRYGLDLNFYISYLENEVQYNNFPVNIQNLKFEEIQDTKIEKPENYNYMILLVESKGENISAIFAKEAFVVLNEEKEFDENNLIFILNYEKKSDKIEKLYIFYEKEIDGLMHIEFNSRIGYNSYSKKGTFNYSIIKSEEIIIYIDTEYHEKGKFKIVSSEYEFSIDADKEIFIPKNKEEDYNIQLQFNITNLDKNYYKLFSPSNNLEGSILYSINEGEPVSLKSPLFLLRKDELIKFKIETKNIDDIIHISNIDESNISDLSYNIYDFRFPINKIFKINYFDTPIFEIETKGRNNFYISYVTKEQYESLPNNLEELSFNQYNESTYEKPYNISYSILIVEILNPNTTLNISKLEFPIYELNFDSEKPFNLYKSNYQFEYTKIESNELLFLLYNISENGGNFNIAIDGPNEFKKTVAIDNMQKNGIYAFENGESGNYIIKFSSKNIFEGIFKLVKSPEQFIMNINENIRINTFEVNFKPNPIVIEFNIENKEYEVYKKFLIGENEDNLKLVQISNSTESNYKNLNLNLYAFQGNKNNYKIKINYKELGENRYKFEQFIMDNFTEYNLDDFKYGVQKYNNDKNIKFIKIYFKETAKIKVDTKNNPEIKIAYYNGNINMTTILNELNFEKLENYLKDKFILDNSYEKAILMIKLKEGETEIDFSDDKNEDKEEDHLLLILAIVIPVGIILLLIIIFLICRFYKKKNLEIKVNESYTKEEELMPKNEV